MPTTPALWHLYRGLILDHTFLAAYMHRHAARHDLDDAGLAALLGCPVDALPLVGLCFAPRDAADRAAVEAAFGLRGGVLVGVGVGVCGRGK